MLIESIFKRKKREEEVRPKIWTYLKTFKVINGKKVYLITCAKGKLE
jgi:hypothetical protein